MPDPTKPYVVLAPEPSSPFHGAWDTVSVVPDWEYVPYQPLCTAPPAGRENTVFQPLIMALPALTVTAAW